jgi:1-acyl-sn-glycerol-3-phosphate acyltransferase
VRKVRDITYPPVISVARLGFKALGLKISIDGARHIPKSGGAVLAFNHVSYVDFIFGGLAARPSKRLVRFMAKRELFDHKVTGPLMRSLHHINVDRDDGMDSYQTALRYLADGEVVGLFPEATISRSFELKDFKSGTVRMAYEAGVPLIPVVVWGTQRIYTKDHPRDFSRGKAITISVGPAVPLTGTAMKDTETLRSDLTSLLDTAIRAYPQHEDGAWWVPKSYGGSAPSREEAAKIERAEARERAEKRRAERQASKQDPTSGAS